MSKYDQKNQKVNTQVNAENINIGAKEITCPKCQNINPLKAKFCFECGTSLLYTCPVCNSDSPLGASYCSGCGKAISKIQEDIEIAQKIRGGENREISYTFHTGYETSVVRETLAVDEYMVLKESGVTFYKENQQDAFGNLFLTNKRIIVLGSEANSPRVFDRKYSFPFVKISHVEAKTEKILFFTSQYLQIIFDGKVRKFELPEKVIKTWIDKIFKLRQDG